MKPSSIELFAGGGGLALGFERAGFDHTLLCEKNKDARDTLQLNRPSWHVAGDVCNLDFTPYQGKVDIVTGGFPCQAFSLAGKKLGFEDTRGTLFFELARCIKETQPILAIGENVKGLVNHDNGKTLATLYNAIDEIGYRCLAPRVLNALDYDVPQDRERLFLVMIRKDVNLSFRWPKVRFRKLTLRDVLFKGELYDTDVPPSPSIKYSQASKRVLDLVPPGGCWKNLPSEVQREYLGNSYQSVLRHKGNTGVARRLSYDSYAPTLLCKPYGKQTELCHPAETRTLSVREYARIQTFPDSWTFSGSRDSQYRQIGNAVPVNLAYAMACSAKQLIDTYRKVSV